MLPSINTWFRQFWKLASFLVHYFRLYISFAILIPSSFFNNTFRFDLVSKRLTCPKESKSSSKMYSQLCPIFLFFTSQHSRIETIFGWQTFCFDKKAHDVFLYHFCSSCKEKKYEKRKLKMHKQSQKKKKQFRPEIERRANRIVCTSLLI